MVCFVFNVKIIIINLLHCVSYTPNTMRKRQYYLEYTFLKKGKDRADVIVVKDVDQWGNQIINKSTKLAKDAIIEILNGNLNGLNKDSAMALKLINFNDMDYFAQRNFIRNFINKIIYQKNRLTFFFNTDPIILSAYTGDSLNENNNSLEFITDNANNQIIYEKQVVINRGLSSNVYNAGKVGLMSVNDNNRLIVRAFAYAWKFKKLYEKGIRMEDIMKQEKMTKRTIYKYLNLAYLSPRIVNQLLSGTLTINLQTLFDIASKNLSFEEQENNCYTK